VIVRSQSSTGSSEVPQSEGPQEATESPLLELTIAQGIVELVSRRARGRTVSRAGVRLGRAHKVAPGSLDFAFLLLTAGTALDGVELDIEEVEGEELAVGRLRVYETRPRR
jgi:hypothetical protein